MMSVKRVRAVAGAAWLLAMAAQAWAPPENGFVTNQAANTVTVFDPITGFTVTTLTGFNSPYGIVGVNSRRKVYVSNSGATPGTITIINADTLAVVNTVTVANSANLRGLDVSADDNVLFVAGYNTLLSQAGVFAVNLATETASYQGGIGFVAPATDCVVCRSSAMGGTGGAGPGRIFYTVPQLGGSFIGVIDINVGAPGPASIAPPAGTDLPRAIARSPDDRRVLVACDDTTAANVPLIVVDALNATAVAVSLSPVGGGAQTLDVSFRPELAPMRAYVLGGNAVANTVYRVDAFGALVDQSTTTPPPMAGTLNHHIDSFSLDDRIYLGDQLNGLAFERMDSSSSPAAAFAGDYTAGAGPRKFAFLPQPLGSAPRVFATCPSGSFDALPVALRVEGQNFQPGSVVRLDDGVGVSTLTTSFIDSSTLLATAPVPALTAGRICDVIVENPDFQTGQLTQVLAVYGAAAPSPALTIPLPGRFAGYEMKSFPQYASTDDLLQALQAQLGPYNPFFYRVFLWFKGDYVELDQLPQGTCDLAGRAFWVLTRFGAQATLARPDVQANTVARTNQYRVVPIPAGWSLVALPLAGSVGQMPWAAVGVTADGTNPASAVSVTAAPALISPDLYDRVNRQYVLSNTLERGKGYFVLNVSGGPVFLVFDGALVTKPGQEVAPTFTSLAAGSPQPPPPPDGGLTDEGSSSGCAMLGLESFLVLALVRLAFPRRRRTRKVGA